MNVLARMPIVILFWAPVAQAFDPVAESAANQQALEQILQTAQQELQDCPQAKQALSRASGVGESLGQANKGAAAGKSGTGAANGAAGSVGSGGVQNSAPVSGGASGVNAGAGAASAGFLSCAEGAGAGQAGLMSLAAAVTAGGAADKAKGEGHMAQAKSHRAMVPPQEEAAQAEEQQGKPLLPCDGKASAVASELESLAAKSGQVAQRCSSDKVGADKLGGIGKGLGELAKALQGAQPGSGGGGGGSPSGGQGGAQGGDDGLGKKDPLSTADLVGDDKEPKTDLDRDGDGVVTDEERVAVATQPVRTNTSDLDDRIAPTPSPSPDRHSSDNSGSSDGSGGQKLASTGGSDGLGGASAGSARGSGGGSSVGVSSFGAGGSSSFSGSIDESYAPGATDADGGSFNKNYISNVNGSGASKGNPFARSLATKGFQNAVDLDKYCRANPWTTRCIARRKADGLLKQ